jgi:Amidohydrolase
MKAFDAHLHLPTPDRSGVDALCKYLERTDEVIGGNLILNAEAEIEAVYEHLSQLPATLNLIPRLGVSDLPAELTRSGWFKIHPPLQNLTSEDIPAVIKSVATDPVSGLVVHCFPWGPDRRTSIGLELVLALAQAVPSTPIVVAHGGGYESWLFRAHAGGYRNIYFEFSVTLAYYRGSDLLGPLQRYLVHSPDRVLFGSDWPSAGLGEQWDELTRLAAEVGIDEGHLEELLLHNSATLWPAVDSVE